MPLLNFIDLVATTNFKRTFRFSKQMSELSEGLLTNEKTYLRKCETSKGFMETNLSARRRLEGPREQNI